MLSTWSRLAVFACAIAWAALATAYLLLAFQGHATLPSPYNALIALALSTATAAAVSSWLAGRVDRRLAEMERRHALLYAQGGRIEMGLRAFADGPTLVLQRPNLAAVGRAALAAPAEVPPDNVLAFEMGRQVERKTRRPEPGA